MPGPGARLGAQLRCRGPPKAANVAADIHSKVYEAHSKRKADLATKQRETAQKAQAKKRAKKQIDFAKD